MKITSSSVKKMALEFFFKTQDLIDEDRLKQSDVDAIKEWLPSVDVPNIQDELIALFLMSCNSVIKATQETILAYYACKNNAPELYDDRDIDQAELQRSLKVVAMSSVPVRTTENYVVHYFRLLDFTVSHFELIPIMKLSYMLLDIAQERNPPAGLIVVLDMEGMKLFHLTKFKYGAIKKYVTFLQEAFPVQLKSVHVLNTVSFIDKIMALVKLFMTSDLIKLIHFHLPSINMENFFETCVPAECMPKEYGGKLGTVAELHQETIKQFSRKKWFFKAEEEMRKSYYKNNKR